MFVMCFASSCTLGLCTSCNSAVCQWWVAGTKNTIGPLFNIQLGFKSSLKVDIAKNAKSVLF
jgi:hypothetical protein